MAFALEPVLFFLVHVLGTEQITELQGPKDGIELWVNLLPNLWSYSLFENLHNRL